MIAVRLHVNDCCVGEALVGCFPVPAHVQLRWPSVCSWSSGISGQSGQFHLSIDPRVFRIRLLVTRPQRGWRGAGSPLIDMNDFLVSGCRQNHIGSSKA